MLRPYGGVADTSVVRRWGEASLFDSLAVEEQCFALTQMEPPPLRLGATSTVSPYLYASAPPTMAAIAFARAAISTCRYVFRLARAVGRRCTGCDRLLLRPPHRRVRARLRSSRRRSGESGCRRRPAR